MAADSALRTSTIVTSSLAAATIIRTTTAATIPITITRTAGLCGPIGERAAFAVITTGGTAGTIGTAAIGDLCHPRFLARC
jgi:hypothetical protein